VGLDEIAWFDLWAQDGLGLGDVVWRGHQSSLFIVRSSFGSCRRLRRRSSSGESKKGRYRDVGVVCAQGPCGELRSNAAGMVYRLLYKLAAGGYP
jgi:hypothetical protein